MMGGILFWFDFGLVWCVECLFVARVLVDGSGCCFGVWGCWLVFLWCGLLVLDLIFFFSAGSLEKLLLRGCPCFWGWFRVLVCCLESQ